MQIGNCLLNSKDNKSRLQIFCIHKYPYSYNVSYEYNGKQYYASIPEVCNNQSNDLETYKTINVDAYTGKYVSLNPGPVIALCRFVQIFFVILLIFSSISVFFS